jgi:hypothetical protein
MDERVTVYSDPEDPDLLERPFTDEGLPVGRTTWIEGGVLANLAYDRYWADRQGRDPLPRAGGIKFPGQSGSVRDLIEGVDFGVLVTRFWYIRGVDPRTLKYTGLTRDGTFLIENGRVTAAVKNLRFNESIVAMLNNVEAVGEAVRVVASESGGLGPAVVVPPLVVRNFHFTSVSDAERSGLRERLDRSWHSPTPRRRHGQEEARHEEESEEARNQEARHEEESEEEVALLAFTKHVVRGSARCRPRNVSGCQGLTARSQRGSSGRLRSSCQPS